MKSGASVGKDTLSDVMASIKKLSKTDVLVGVPSDRAERGEGMEINNAELAYLHCHGGTIRIPAHDVTIHREVDKDGNLMHNGQFVKKKKANLSTTHHVNSYTVTLPARDFLDLGVAAAKQETTARLKLAAQAILSGDDSGATRALNQAGQIAADSAKNVITAGDQLQALAPSTLADRRSRGRNGTKPLYDTGILLRSITYVLRS